MFYTYVLINNEGLIYKGSTENLEKRLAEHNSSGSSWTSKRRPWRVVYKERHPTRSAAAKRERFFKSGKGREFLKSKF